MSSLTTTKFKVILVYEQLQCGVILPKDITFVNLVRYVKKKFNVCLDTSLTLIYNNGPGQINIIDDEDLFVFVDHVFGTTGIVQKLFITLTTTNQKVLPAPSIDLNVSSYPESTNSNKLLVDYYRVLKLNKRFDTKADCIYEIGLKCIKEGYQYRVHRSNPCRYVVKCIIPDCPWFVYTHKQKNSTQFRVTKLNDIHTCSKTLLNPNHRNVTAKILGRLLGPKFSDVSRVYKPKDIMQDLNMQLNVDVTYKRAWMGKQLALMSNQGCPIGSFADLPVYFHNLNLANPDSVTHIDTDNEGRFKMAFLAFGAAVASFLRYMRPLLIIDAAHLKGPFEGTNLVVVGMDGNNQIIPIATGVTQGETGESWTWFLRHLKECIGEVEGLAIISDRHYAITMACKEVFRNSFHGYCCRYLMLNCKMQGDTVKSLYWKTCKAYTTDSFTYLMSNIRAERPASYKKLVEAGVENWSRAHCPADRYNYLTSNCVESINSLSRHVRKAPVIKVLEWFRELLQRWYYERRAKHEDSPDDELSPWATAKLNDRLLKSSTWQVKGVQMHKIYEVNDYKKHHSVDLKKGMCSCRKWQLSGLPCGHVCAVARFAGLTSVHQLAKPWFLNKTVKATYAASVYPLLDESMWERPEDLVPVLPPLVVKAQPGRPKKKDRIHSKYEIKIQKCCTRCGGNGHNRTTCNKPLVSSTANSGQKRKYNKSQTGANKKTQISPNNRPLTVYRPTNESHREAGTNEAGNNLAQFSTPTTFLN